MEIARAVVEPTREDEGEPQVLSLGGEEPEGEGGSSPGKGSSIGDQNNKAEMKTANQDDGDVDEEPLPPHWSRHRNESGQIFYYNDVTGEQTWDKPTEGEEETSLPDGWKARTDESGRLFYWNVETGDVQWEIPTEAAAAGRTAAVAEGEEKSNEKSGDNVDEGGGVNGDGDKKEAINGVDGENSLGNDGENLPPNWEKKTDEQNRVFYWNKETGDVQWDPPQHVESLQNGNDQTHHHTNGENNDLLQLPDGWEKKIDEETKREFYWNQNSGQVQWEMPEFSADDQSGNKKKKNVDAQGRELPAGWEEHTDSAGRVFFWHISTGTVQWHFPGSSDPDSDAGDASVAGGEMGGNLDLAAANGQNGWNDHVSKLGDLISQLALAKQNAGNGLSQISLDDLQEQIFALQRQRDAVEREMKEHKDRAKHAEDELERVKELAAKNFETMRKQSERYIQVREAEVAKLSAKLKELKGVDDGQQAVDGLVSSIQRETAAFQKSITERKSRGAGGRSQAELEEEVETLRKLLESLIVHKANAQVEIANLTEKLEDLQADPDLSSVWAQQLSSAMDTIQKTIAEYVNASSSTDPPATTTAGTEESKEENHHHQQQLEPSASLKPLSITLPPKSSSSQGRPSVEDKNTPRTAISGSQTPPVGEDGMLSRLMSVFSNDNRRNDEVQPKPPPSFVPVDAVVIPSEQIDEKQKLFEERRKRRHQLLREEKSKMDDAHNKGDLPTTPKSASKSSSIWSTPKSAPPPISSSSATAASPVVPPSPPPTAAPATPTPPPQSPAPAPAASSAMSFLSSLLVSPSESAKTEEKNSSPANERRPSIGGKNSPSTPGGIERQNSGIKKDDAKAAAESAEGGGGGGGVLGMLSTFFSPPPKEERPPGMENVELYPSLEKEKQPEIQFEFTPSKRPEPAKKVWTPPNEKTDISKYKNLVSPKTQQLQQGQQQGQQHPPSSPLASSLLGLRSPAAASLSRSGHSSPRSPIPRPSSTLSSPYRR